MQENWHSPDKKRVLIIAGEASGDLHGANLIKSVRRINSNIHFSGIGSKHMQDAGVDILFKADKIAVVGFFEVLTHFFSIKKAFNVIKHQITKNKPDLVILIDYPGFNLRIAKIAKKANVKVLYYISPQIWAWHKSRIKIIKKYVDQMAVVFPFEVEFYRKANVNVNFVGHPLSEIVKPSCSKEVFCEKYGLDVNQPILGLLPGSRKTEIKRLLSLQLKSAKILKNKYPKIQFILLKAHTLSETDILPYLTQSSLGIKIISDDRYSAINSCDAVIATSGTVTLEIGLLGVPMVMVYKINPITYFLGRNLVKMDVFGICNILAGKKITKEFIQKDATVNNILNEISNFLDDESYRNKVKTELNTIKTKLEAVNAEKSIEDLVTDMLST